MIGQPIPETEADVMAGIVRTPAGVFRVCTIKEAKEAYVFVLIVDFLGRKRLVPVHLP